MWAIVSVVVSSGLRYRSVFCLACISLPSSIMTWGPLVIRFLLLHYVLTLMYLCVGPVLAILYMYSLFSELLLHVVLVQLKCTKLSFEYFTASDPNCKGSGGRP